MPKLLSRSKHEELESNSALQIRNQKERRVENARKLGHCRNFAGLRNCRISQVAKLPPLRTVHFSTLRHCSCCSFEFLTFVPLFCFLPILSHVIAFGFGFFFFCNFALAGAVYKLLVHCNRETFLLTNKTFGWEAFSSSRSFFSFLFSFIFSHFLGCQTPLEDDNSRDGWLNPTHP